MNSASKWFESASAKFYVKDYQGAVADCTLAIGLDPNYAEAYALRGMTRRFLAYYEGSIDDYSKAITLKPEYGGSYQGRGLAYLALGQKRKALEDFMRAIEFGSRVAQRDLDACK